MTREWRIGLFVAAAAIVAAMLLRATLCLPAFGEGHSPYLEYLADRAVDETHATDLPSAINFDYRALDTLGEEFILFASVTGVAVLLREPRRTAKKIRDPEIVPSDRCLQEAVVVACGAVLAVIVVFGVYVTVHAQLTPGGGFQGGAVLGTGILIVYLADGHEVFAKMVRPGLVHLVEAIGAGGYLLIGLAAMAVGGAFLENVLPLGETGQLFSAGTIPVISLAVGFEVSAGFSSLFVDFISELHRPAEEAEP